MVSPQLRSRFATSMELNDFQGGTPSLELALPCWKNGKGGDNYVRTRVSRLLQVCQEGYHLTRYQEIQCCTCHGLNKQINCFDFHIEQLPAESCQGPFRHQEYLQRQMSAGEPSTVNLQVDMET
jgi:hypothetical protein